MSTIYKNESTNNTNSTDTQPKQVDPTVPRTMHTVTVNPEPSNSQRSHIQADIISDIQSLSDEVSLDSNQQKDLVKHLAQQRDEHSVQTTNFSEIPGLYTDLSVSPSKSRLDNLTDEDSEFSEPVDWIEAPENLYLASKTNSPNPEVEANSQTSSPLVFVGKEEEISEISLNSEAKVPAIEEPDRNNEESIQKEDMKHKSEGTIPEKIITTLEHSVGSSNSTPTPTTGTTNTKQKNNYGGGKRLSVISFSSTGGNTVLDNNKALSTADIKTENFYSNLLGNLSINSSASSAVGGASVSVLEFDSKSKIDIAKLKPIEDAVKSTLDLKKEVNTGSDLSVIPESSKSSSEHRLDEREIKEVDTKLKFKSKTFHFGAVLPMEKENVDPFEPVNHDSISFENGMNFIRSDYEHEIESLKEEIQKEREYQEEQKREIQRLLAKLGEFERIAKKQVSLASKSNFELSQLPSHSRQGSSSEVTNAASLFKEFEAYKRESIKKISQLDHLLKEEKTKNSRFEVLKIENEDLKAVIVKKDEALETLKEQNFTLLKQLNDRDKQLAMNAVSESGSLNQLNSNNRISIGQPGYVRQVRNSILSPAGSMPKLSKLTSPSKVTFADAVHKVMENLEAEEYENQIRAFKENVAQLQEKIDGLNSTIEEKDQTIDELQASLEELGAQFKEIKDDYEINNLLNQVESAKMKAEVANRERADIEDKLCQSNSTIATVSNQLKEFHEYVLQAEASVSKINAYALTDYPSAKEEDMAFQEVKILLAPQIAMFVDEAHQEIMSKIRREMGKVLNQVKNAHDMKRSYAVMEKEVADMKSKLGSIESELDGQFQKTLEKVNKEKASLESQLVSLEYTKKSLEAEITELKTDNKEKENEILDLQEELKYVQSEWDLHVKQSTKDSTTDETLKSYEEQIKQLKTQLEDKQVEIQGWVEKLQSLEDKLKDVTKTLDAKMNELDILNGRLVELQDQNQTLKADGIALQEKIQEMSSQMERFDSVETERKVWKEKAEAFEQQALEKTATENSNKELQNQLIKLEQELISKNNHLMELNEKNLAVQEDLNLQIKSLEGEIIDLKREADSSVLDKADEILKLKEEVETLEWEKEKLNNDANYHSQRISELTAALDDARANLAKQENALLESTNKMQSEIEALKSINSELQTLSLQKDSDISAYERKLEALTFKYEDLTRMKNDLVMSVENLKDGEETQRDEASALQKEVQRLTSKCSKLELEVKELELSSNKLQQEIDDKNRELKQMKAFSEKVVHENENKLSELLSTIEKQEEIISKSKKDIAQKSDKINELSDKYRDLENSKSLADKQISRLETHLAQAQDLAATIPKLNFDLSHSKDTISALEHKISKLELLATKGTETESLQKQISSLKLDLEDKEKKLFQESQDNATNKNLLKESEKKLLEAQDEILSVNANYDKANHRIKSLETQLKKLGSHSVQDDLTEDLMSKYQEAILEIESLKRRVKAANSKNGKDESAKIIDAEIQIENLQDLISSRASILNQICQTWKLTSLIQKSIPTYKQEDLEAGFVTNREYLEGHFKIVLNLLDQLKLQVVTFKSHEEQESDGPLSMKIRTLQNMQYSEVQAWGNAVSLLKSYIADFKNQVIQRNVALDQAVQAEITSMKSIQNHLQSTLDSKNQRLESPRNDLFEGSKILKLDQTKLKGGIFDNPMFRDAISKLQSEIQELKWKEQIFEREVQNERHQNHIDKLTSEDAKREKRVLEGKVSVLEKELSKSGQRIENVLLENTKLENQIQDLERQIAKKESAIRQCFIDIQIEKDNKSVLLQDLEKLQQKVIELSAQKTNMLKLNQQLESKTQLQDASNEPTGKQNTLELEIVEKLKKLESNIIQISDAQQQSNNSHSAVQAEHAPLKRNCGNPACNLDYIKKKVHKLEAELHSKYKKKMAYIAEVYRKQLEEREKLEQKRARNENLLKQSYEHRIKSLQRRLDSRCENYQ
ncbi:hypothetical protein HK103_003556 [Boothiomyces macroporosus]|uniref:Uncharacterized protein n=1 Tax=Boothiomyces macroporosus TaxID=261099 RepID=A0AAD5UHQ1_9FUNG|nr:hypothetical protein HK103_003556 [Boothiomyces macroporosus]